MITPSGRYSKDALDYYLEKGIEQYELRSLGLGVRSKILTSKESEALSYGMKLIFADSLNEIIKGTVQGAVLHDLESNLERSYQALEPKEKNTIDARIFQRSTRDSEVHHDQFWIDFRAGRLLHSVARELAIETCKEHTRIKEITEKQLADLQDPNAFPPLGSTGKATKKR